MDVVALFISLIIVVLMYRNVLLCEYTDRAISHALSHISYIKIRSKAVEEFIKDHQSIKEFLKKRFQFTKWRYEDFYGDFEYEIRSEKEIVDNQKEYT